MDEPIAGEGLIAAIHSLSHKLMLLYSQIVYVQTGLNWQDWRILRAVVRLQTCRAQDICDECGLQKPHVSNGLARLEKAGHIERSRNPDNAKVKLVRSTAQGESLVEKAQPVLDGLNAQISTKATSGEGLLKELRGYQSELDKLAKATSDQDT
ncbi:MAG: MarR family winged helix-turn-helix transcriptional regulator [Pseudomonadota bacterium]